MDKSEATNIANRYVNLVAKKYPVQKAWLFGSYAKGSHHADSDIDVALLMQHNYDMIDLQIDLMKIRREVDLRIEPHPFTEQNAGNSSLFQNEINKYGIEMTTAM